MVAQWPESPEVPEAFAHGGRIAPGDLAIVAGLHWLKFGVLAMITLLVAMDAKGFSKHLASNLTKYSSAREWN